MQRCFIKNGNDVKAKVKARRLLRQFACHGINATNTNIDTTDWESIKEEVGFMKDNLPGSCFASFERMLRDTADPGEQKLQKALGILYKILSHSRSVDLLLPFTNNEHLPPIYHLSAVEAALNCTDASIPSDIFKERCTILHRLCPEVADVLKYSSLLVPTGLPSADVCNLVLHIVEQVMDIHQNDLVPAPAVPMDGTYNPGKYGRAYYFTNHGCQLRQVRSFKADNVTKGKEEVECTKNYPNVSKKGMSYLFLWVCAHHMHCMGFHMIPSSEGSKDASASLYTHAEKAPLGIFYDNACELAEYVKSRESGFFANTQFYHDKFHGFSHKCPRSLDSGRINSLITKGTNTSVCEEINSFLQRIKGAGRLMSQNHFAFFLQFFIYQWNRDNRLKYGKHLSTIIDGMV